MDNHHYRWINKIEYEGLVHWSEYNYEVLEHIEATKQQGKQSKYKESRPTSCAIISFDTETSKERRNDTFTDKDGVLKYIPVPNYVVAWSLSIRVHHINLVTLYGHKPSSFISCLHRLRTHMVGDIIMFAHNLAYDWQFLKGHIIEAFDVPEYMLATKTHYPVSIKFPNGICLRDSLIMAQRTLDKWAKDLDVEHKKQGGKWDYEKIRTQHEQFTSDERDYIEGDVLALVECIDRTISLWGCKNVSGLPLTATGKIRNDLYRFASKRERYIKNAFNKCTPKTLDEYQRIRRIYHGGYTHANRHYIGKLVQGNVVAYDFASSYPYCMVAEKFPKEWFKPSPKLEHCSVEELLDDCHTKDKTAIAKVRFKNIELVSDDLPMPYLQRSKCQIIGQYTVDNGRILRADELIIDTTDISLQLISDMYEWDFDECADVKVAKLGYLPRWYTDFIWEKWVAKCQLKGGDEVLYKIAKSDINGCYGMAVQEAISDNIVEDYSTGIYSIESQLTADNYENLYIKNRRKILPYIWGVYITEYAVQSLYRMGACAGTWLYSDTDSCYGLDWDEVKLNEFNKERKRKLEANGYGVVQANSKDLWLGIAELDGVYQSFKTLGCKRYAVEYRDVSDERDRIKITVAGVPKNGRRCLTHGIRDFAEGFIFKGTATGKLTHSYGRAQYSDKSIEGYYWVDLTPCDYKLSRTHIENHNEMVILYGKE